uniref:Uncharacterized protein n=1 Tax=Rhizophora mucronata TaxID=61149 RepID=A0A2P2N9Y4_RHIMU
MPVEAIHQITALTTTTAGKRTINSSDNGLTVI